MSTGLEESVCVYVCVSVMVCDYSYLKPCPQSVVMIYKCTILHTQSKHTCEVEEEETHTLFTRFFL